MDRIEVEDFGALSRFDAAYVLDENANILAYVPEPEERNDHIGEWPDEEEFRDVVRERVRDWYGQDTAGLILQWDPGRDQALDEYLDA